MELDYVYRILDWKYLVAGIYFAVTKAFDMHHDLLLIKSSNSVRCVSLQLFRSSLSSITQFTCIVEEKGGVCLGAPQGSILGPSSLLVYVNDLSAYISSCDLRHYTL